MMEMIDDEMLDKLLQDSAHRQEVVSQINANVMETVSRESHKVKVKAVIRLLAFCFGVPLLLFLPALALFVNPEPKLSVSTIAVAVSLLFFYIPVIIRLNEIFKRPIL